MDISRTFRHGTLSQCLDGSMWIRRDEAGALRYPRRMSTQIAQIDIGSVVIFLSGCGM